MGGRKELVVVSFAALVLFGCGSNAAPSDQSAKMYEAARVPVFELEANCGRLYPDEPSGRNYWAGLLHRWIFPPDAVGNLEALCMQYRAYREAELKLGPSDYDKDLSIPPLLQPGLSSPTTSDSNYGWIILLDASSREDRTKMLDEMSHETVHIIDGPSECGTSNYLEEAVAEAFVLHMLDFPRGGVLENTRFSHTSQSGHGLEYRRALDALDEIATDSRLDDAKAIRARFGSLGDVTEQDLAGVYPDADKATIQLLAKKFPCPE